MVILIAFLCIIFCIIFGALWNRTTYDTKSEKVYLTLFIIFLVITFIMFLTWIILDADTYEEHVKSNEWTPSQICLALNCNYTGKDVFIFDLDGESEPLIVEKDIVILQDRINASPTPNITEYTIYTKSTINDILFKFYFGEISRQEYVVTNPGEIKVIY